MWPFRPKHTVASVMRDLVEGWHAGTVVIPGVPPPTPETPMTPPKHPSLDRTRQIVAESKRRAAVLQKQRGYGDWIAEASRTEAFQPGECSILTADEQAEIGRLWNSIPGNTGWEGALLWWLYRDFPGEGADEQPINLPELAAILEWAREYVAQTGIRPPDGIGAVVMAMDCIAAGQAVYDRAKANSLTLTAAAAYRLVLDGVEVLREEHARITGAGL